MMMMIFTSKFNDIDNYFLVSFSITKVEETIK